MKKIIIILLLILVLFIGGCTETYNNRKTVNGFETYPSSIYNESYFNRKCDLTKGKIIDTGIDGLIIEGESNFNSGNIMYFFREELFDLSNTHIYDICSGKTRDFDKKMSISGNVGIYFEFNEQDSDIAKIELNKGGSNIEGQGMIRGIMIPMLPKGTYVFPEEYSSELEKYSGYNLKVRNHSSEYVELLLSSYDIHAFDILTEKDDVIVKGLRNPGSHDLYDGLFAYTYCNYWEMRNENCRDGDIHLYDFKTGKTKKLSSDKLSYWRPRVSEEYVIFTVKDESCAPSNYLFPEDECLDFDVGIYEIKQDSMNILELEGIQYEPEISGDYIVWEEADKLGFIGYANVYLYNIKTGGKKKITGNNKNNGQSPASLDIFGNYVVWKDYKPPYKVHYYNILTEETKTLDFSGTDFTTLDTPRIWNNIIIGECLKKTSEGYSGDDICYYAIE